MMVSAEEILAIILDLLVESNNSKAIWIKDEGDFTKGYVAFEDDNGTGFFIVTVQNAELKLV